MQANADSGLPKDMVIAWQRRVEVAALAIAALESLQRTIDAASREPVAEREATGSVIPRP